MKKYPFTVRCIEWMCIYRNLWKKKCGEPICVWEREKNFICVKPFCYAVSFLTFLTTSTIHKKCTITREKSSLPLCAVYVCDNKWVNYMKTEVKIFFSIRRFFLLTSPKVTEILREKNIIYSRKFVFFF